MSMLLRALVFTGVLAATAAAAPITYTFSMLGAGTLNGNNFTATTVTFSFNTDTSLIGTVGTGVFVTPSNIGGTFDLAGFANGQLTPAGLHLFDNQNNSLSGIGTTLGDFLQEANPSFAAYDLTSALGPVPQTVPTFIDPNGIATNLGQLDLTSVRSLTFTAATSATPEPSVFALIGSGLLGVAWLVRKRR